MPYKQIFVVNRDLNMGVGKCCSQVAHAETLYMEDIMINYADIESSDNSFTDKYFQWKDDSVKPIGVMKKIVIRATDDQITSILLRLIKEHIRNYIVYDLGLTQVESGALTCICTEPIEEDIANKIFGHLKLL